MYLIATNLGLFNHSLVFDIFLSTILNKDKKEFRVVLCDGILPACQMSKMSRTMPRILATEGQKETCTRCFKRGIDGYKDHIRNFDEKLIKFSDYVSPDEVQKIDKSLMKKSLSSLKSLKYDKANVGEQGYASTLRYFSRGDLGDEKYALPILRKYVTGAIASFLVFDRILKQSNYEKVIAHHGIYTPQGLVVTAAKLNKVKVVTSVKSYKMDTFVLSHDDTYHHTMITEKKENWRDFEFEIRDNSLLKDYSDARRSGDKDWISFNKTPTKINDPNLKQIDYLLLTSVLWDAQVHYKSNLFDGILNWIIETINYWIKTQKKENLNIRIHPAEVNGYIKSRQLVADEIKQNFSRIPKNIRIIYPDDTTSTYDLIEEAKCILVYNTKTAIEASALGKNVVVCGDAWVKNKGFTIDPKNEKEYFLILKNNAGFKPLSTKKTLLAKKYAYHFFFRRMIPVQCFEKDELQQLKLKKNYFNIYKSLELENSIDVIRNGIYLDHPFIFKKELLKDIENKENYQSDFIFNLSKSCVLQDYTQIELATDILDKLNTKNHHDKSKNWDILKMYSVVYNLNKNFRFLDAGSGGKAPIANILNTKGYKNIYTCDILDHSKRFLGKNIKFSIQDVCNTKYKNNYFDCIMSGSVIEHVVDPESHILEMSRILKPQGDFLLTTDYWPIKQYTKNIYPYGENNPEMRVFSQKEIKNLIKFAEGCNLKLDNSNLDLRSTSKVCNWKRVDKSYTFIFLRFKKF